MFVLYVKGELCFSIVGLKEKSELKQSSTSPEDTPLYEAIENIIYRMRECEESNKIRTMKIFKMIKMKGKQLKTLD